MRIFYCIGIFLYRLGIFFASPFNAKARLWQQGRKNIFEKLSLAIHPSDHPVWIHSASLGEYEQAKPLIEKIKASSPNTKVLATFFSPSGYEIRKNDSLPDYVFYLPMDSIRNVRRFMDIVQPSMALFVKYEYWFNYIHELNKRDVPFYYVCAIFRPTQYFFKPIGNWFALQLKKAAGFFVQNETSANLLKSIGISNIEICGDTRFDRVHAIASLPYTLDFVEQFKQDSKLLVAGSTWQPDEQLLSQLFSNLSGYKMVVAPHEISRVQEVLNTFRSFKVIQYSNIQGHNLADYDILILDTIGILSKVYKYSTISYVGGAFKTGLHNILEAAVFGVPLFYGPHYSKFNEAVALVQSKGAFSVTSATQMLDIIKRFQDKPNYYEETCSICQEYVNDNIGAVDKIASAIGF